MSLYEMMLYFFIYGFLGWCTEIAYAAVRERRFINRGFLHGPICPIYGVGVTLVVQLLAPYRANLLFLYLASVVLVTIVEGTTGFLLEKIFHRKWWDYSQHPLNIKGYVCLPFSLIWGVACVLIVRYIQEVFGKGVEFLPQGLGIFFLVILDMVLFVDLYVTAAGILKMNRHLAHMEEIAEELRHISDEAGKRIFKGVIEALEFQDGAKGKLMDAKEGLQEKTQGIKDRTGEVTDEIKEHIAELEGRYKELLAKSIKLSKRLVEAFPKMDASNYKRALSDIRNYVKTLRK